MAIIDQVRAGIDLARTGADPSGARTMELVVEPDRASAIRAAVDRALPGDVVVVAGKGHETTQALADGVIPFDDREEARRAIDERGPHGDGIGGHDR